MQKKSHCRTHNSAFPSLLQPVVLSKAEAARFARVSERTLDAARSTRSLTSYKIGARVLFRVEDLLAWIAEQREV
jgi:hypothetical protein